MSALSALDRIILLTNDDDWMPAMKHAGNKGFRSFS